MHSTVPKFQCIALEPKILSKRWFAWTFHEIFFSCYADFTWIWTYKTQVFTDHQLTIGSFLLAICSMGADQQISRWPWFFQQLLFLFVCSPTGFILLILLQSLLIDSTLSLFPLQHRISWKQGSICSTVCLLICLQVGTSPRISSNHKESAVTCLDTSPRISSNHVVSVL